jgi:hypothetical protein
LSQVKQITVEFKQLITPMHIPDDKTVPKPH